jgi:mono/diheme cytochrome c family protein
MRRLVLLTVIAPVLVFSQTKGDTGGNAANGKKFFTSYGCWQCHGYEGQGGAAGPRIAPRPISLAALTTYVRHPTGQMPPFTSKVVPDSDLVDIHAYLRSVREPPAVKNIPLLNQ